MQTNGKALEPVLPYGIAAVAPLPDSLIGPFPSRSLVSKVEWNRCALLQTFMPDNGVTG